VIDSSSSPGDEVRALTDAQFDGSINRQQMERLESLIVNDLGCLQMYVERMTFHGELLKDASEKSPHQATLGLMREFSRSIRVREQQNRWKQMTFVSGLAAGVLVVAGSVLFFAGAFQPAPLGVISGLSANVQSASASRELGQIIRAGDSFTLDEGIMSLQLPNVLVDLIGPATVRFDESGKLSLAAGTLVAKILKDGENFTVTTPDAEVVDLGTEFSVHYHPATGTDVSVRQGRVQAKLLDWRKAPTKMLELTDNRSANFQSGTGAAQEVNFNPQTFHPVDRSRGGIRSIDGTLRTATAEPASLRSGDSLTFNHTLVIPERQNVRLEEELTINGLNGVVSLPAGTVISSYLVHYDPPGDISRAPRGAVTFLGQVAAVVVQTSDLVATDPLLGLSSMEFETASFRGLEIEPDEDEVQVSRDRKTVSFRFDTSPPQYLDEARIIVISE